MVLLNCFISELHVDATANTAQAQIRTSPGQPWTNISLPYSMSLLGNEGTVGSYQLRFTSSSNNSSDTWEVFDVTMGAYGGIQPTSPAIDFAKDGILEWGGSDARVGSWGWQDRFENGLTYISANPGISRKFIGQGMDSCGRFDQFHLFSTVFKRHTFIG